MYQACAQKHICIAFKMRVDFRGGTSRGTDPFFDMTISPPRAWNASKDKKYAEHQFQRTPKMQTQLQKHKQSIKQVGVQP